MAHGGAALKPVGQLSLITARLADRRQEARPSRYAPRS
jgi:hypothetical protein